MDAVQLEISSLTDRYQTTVPTAVRKALNVGKRDKLEYVVQNDGTVILRRAGAEHVDSALSGFLGLVERDIAEHPQRLTPMSITDKNRIDTLVGSLKVDLDKPLRSKR